MIRVDQGHEQRKRWVQNKDRIVSHFAENIRKLVHWLVNDAMYLYSGGVETALERETLCRLLTVPSLAPENY